MLSAPPNPNLLNFALPSDNLPIIIIITMTSVAVSKQVPYQEVLLTINLPVDVVERFPSQPPPCKERGKKFNLLLQIHNLDSTVTIWMTL